jgi:hypothetical protein
MKPCDSFIRINGIEYSCHSEVKELFKTLFNNQMIGVEARESLERENRELRLEIERLKK